MSEAAEACPQPFVELAHRLADAAGETVRRYFRSGLAVDDKPDLTPVTAADREAEAAMRALIADTFQEHGVIGEEHAAERPEAEYVWVLDPIDGTKRFVTGNPGFGTLVGLLRRGRPILGVIDMPMLGERWVGADGRPARHRDAAGERPARVRPCAEPAAAMLYVTSPEMFQGSDAAAFARVREAVRFPVYGGDCYAYGLLASGFADLVVEADMDATDVMALVPVVESAGGHITDWQGRPLGLASDGRVLAAGDRRLHAAVAELLAG